ncbi:MAG: hypothetical protein H5T86_13220 [Armatimonadetes bacterium]|nr:hypothetical protein [Armatimonadota bacterium]
MLPDELLNTTEQSQPAGTCGVVVKLLRSAQAARPEVRIENWNGRLVVVKDYRVRATPLKLWVGRYLVRRELAAHKRLAGIDGIPEAIPTPDEHVFAHEYVEGWPAPEVPERLDSEFFEALYELVREIHRRAVAHGDLKRLENILVRPDGSPALVDLSAAIMSGSNPLAAVLLGYMQDDDLRAIAKLKARHAPHLLTGAERQLLVQRSAAESLWRWARSYLRPWLQSRSDSHIGGMASQD